MTLDEESAHASTCSTLLAMEPEEVQKSGGDQELDKAQDPEKTLQSGKAQESADTLEETRGRDPVQPHTDEKAVPLSNGELQNEPRELFEIKEPVILIDPLGTRWELPFDVAKDWKVCSAVATGS